MKEFLKIPGPGNKKNYITRKHKIGDYTPIKYSKKTSPAYSFG